MISPMSSSLSHLTKAQLMTEVRQLRRKLRASLVKQALLSYQVRYPVKQRPGRWKC